MWSLPRIGLIGLLLVGALARIIPLTDNRLHPDEALFSTLARLIASGRDSWLAQTSLLVDKPPLFYYTLSGAVLIAGGNEVALRLPALLFSIITLALVARLAWRLWQSWIAVWAAVIIAALSPFAILFSPTVFSDPQFVMWLFAALVAVCERHWGWGGVLIGLSIACKQSALYFLPLVILVGLIQDLARGTRPKPILQNLLRFGGGLGLVLVLIVGWDELRAPAPSFWASAVGVNDPGRLIRSNEVWPRASAWLSWAASFTGSRPADAALLALLIGAAPAEILSGRRERSGASLMILLAALVGYVTAIWFVAFPLLDRYLLPVIYLVALICGRGAQLLVELAGKVPRLRSARHMLAGGIGIGLVAVMLPGAAQASRSGFPVGGDHGAYAGIDQMAEYLGERPMGTVVYAHQLSWMLDFYLFDEYVYRAYFLTPRALADDLRSFGGTQDERYLMLAGSESSIEIEDAIGAAGYRLIPIRIDSVGQETSGLRLFRVARVP